MVLVGIGARRPSFLCGLFEFSRVSGDKLRADHSGADEFDIREYVGSTVSGCRSACRNVRKYFLKIFFLKIRKNTRVIDTLALTEMKIFELRDVFASVSKLVVKKNP